MRHPRQESHHHAKGHPASPSYPRRTQLNLHRSPLYTIESKSFKLSTPVHIFRMAEESIRQCDFAAFRRAWDEPHSEPHLLLDLAISRFNSLIKRCLCSDALLEKWSINGMENKMRGAISIISFLKHQNRKECPAVSICDGLDRPFLVLALFNGVCGIGSTSTASPTCPLSLRNRILQSLLLANSIPPSNSHKRASLLLLFVVDRIAEVVEILGKKFLVHSQELLEHLMALSFATGHDRAFKYFASSMRKFPVLYDWDTAIHFMGTDTDGCLESLVGLSLKDAMKFPVSTVLSSPKFSTALPALSFLRPSSVSDESLERCSGIFGEFAATCLKHQVRHPMDHGLDVSTRDEGRKEIPAAVFLAEMRGRKSRANRDSEDVV